MSGAGYTTQGAVAVIRLDNPPVNGLGHAVRVGILAGLDRANADPAISAVVLAGAGKSFSAGADINELGTPKSLQEPNLPTVIREIERNEKPVIAALHGVAMGGGLELALGCHYRVAAPGTQISLPEVKLGLLPGAGGTQRLPRALGLEAALNVIVSGWLIRASTSPHPDAVASRSVRWSKGVTHTARRVNTHASPAAWAATSPLGALTLAGRPARGSRPFQGRGRFQPIG